MLQTKDLLELKPINITNVTPSLATATALLSTAALLNSTISTTTTAATTTATVSSVVDVLPPICSSEMTECPFVPLVTVNVPHDAAGNKSAPPETTTMPAPPETTTMPAIGRSTAAKGSTTRTANGSTTVCSVDDDSASDCLDADGKTTASAEGGTTSKPGVVNATVDYHIELGISGRVVEQNASEDAAAASVTTAGFTDYEPVASSVTVTSPVTESAISTDPTATEWTAAISTSLTATAEWTVTSPTVTERITTNPATESSSTDVPGIGPTARPDAESVADSSADDAVAEEPNSVRTKRLSEILFNGTHCYRIVCSPRPSTPAPNVTDAPKTTQQFTEKPYSKYNYCCVLAL